MYNGCIIMHNRSKILLWLMPFCFCKVCSEDSEENTEDFSEKVEKQDKVYNGPRDILFNEN